ncbi:MAG: hypothetical protein KAV42_05345 [Candidatus Krumholzibacteria bacterium]|nr:hypothetical protein [Candidatus Krumholzibacteria bacterium]
MKKLNLFLSLILILVMGTAASAQTVDDVISKATAAIGGQSAIDAVKSIRMTMTGTLMGGESSMEVLIVKPNCKMIKSTIQGMEIITATNGTDYWRSQLGQVTDMTASAREQFGSSFNQYSADGIADLIGNGTFTYSGKEVVNGISADVVKGAFTGSGPVSMYFDPTGLPFRMLMYNDEGDLDMYITDYRDVGGVKIAYKFESIVKGSSLMVMEITKAEANVDIDLSIFDKPAQ